MNNFRFEHAHIHPHEHPHSDGQKPIHHPSRRDFLRLSALGLAGVLLSSCARDVAAQPLADEQIYLPVVTAQAMTASPLAGFDAFKDQINLFTEGDYLRIESSGIPTHGMMVGIVSWQQQVPLPQNYMGANAWTIPLHPVLSDTPISAKNALYRGAIALAVNGIPIFNALNNRGDDTYLAGELDEWGGHCGRADDYHYHMAPLHLQAIAGSDSPIAYALDGFPIYGTTEPDGSAVTGLDEFNGHFDTGGNYHYHASDTYPYINGGLRGVVDVRNDQIEPQPQLTPIRPAGEPLRGAVITGFNPTGSNGYSLEYTLAGRKYYVNYEFTDTTYTFEFVDADGNRRSETYTQA